MSGPKSFIDFQLSPVPQLEDYKNSLIVSELASDENERVTGYILKLPTLILAPLKLFIISMGGTVSIRIVGGVPKTVNSRWGCTQNSKH